MKIYIFLTNTIFDIGGGQLHIKNKLNLLTKSGWQVMVFSSETGNRILLNELETSVLNIIPELRYLPYLYTERRRNKVLSNILKRINEQKHQNKCEIVIESHFVKMSYWGELLAELLLAKNIVYLIQETFHKLSKVEVNYFLFKLKRKELAGIAQNSLVNLFNMHVSIKPEEQYFLNALTINTNVIDYPMQEVDSILRADINIGCISRLDKFYIKKIIEEVIIYCNQHVYNQVQLILIGDSNNESLLKFIDEKSFEVSNLRIIKLGRIFPLPKRLFEKIDFFIGAAGSALITAYEGKLTLTLNVETGLPVGLLGIDTLDVLYGKPINNLTISQWITRIINIGNSVEEKDLKQMIIADLKKINLEDEFKIHMRFMESSNQICEYSTKFLNNQNVPTLMNRIAMSVFGMSLFEKIKLILYKLSSKKYRH